MGIYHRQPRKTAQKETKKNAPSRRVIATKKGFESDQTSKPFHTIKLNPVTAGKPLLKGF